MEEKKEKTVGALFIYSIHRWADVWPAIKYQARRTLCAILEDGRVKHLGPDGATVIGPATGFDTHEEAEEAILNLWRTNRNACEINSSTRARFVDFGRTETLPIGDKLYFMVIHTRTKETDKLTLLTLKKY